MIVVMLVQLYASRVILRTLGFEDYGIYNVIGSVVVFFGFLNTALHNATSRYLTYDLGKSDLLTLNQTYSMAVKCHLLLAVILFLLMEVVGVWFVNSNLNIPEQRIFATNWAFQFSLLTFCTHIVTVPFNANIVAHERMSVYALVSIIDAVLKLIIVYLLLISPVDKLISYSLLLFVESVSVLALQVLYCRIKLKDTHFIIKYWNRDKIYQFASYSGWSMVVNGADGATTQCRSVFFNWFLGTIANAALGIATQVITLLNVFVANFSQSFRPQIIKSYAAGDKQYFIKLIYSTSKISCYLFLLISIPIILNLNFILYLWLGEYPENTAEFVGAIIIFAVIDAFQQPLWTAVHATGNLKTHQLIIGGIKILAIPITYFSLKFGYSAVFTLYLWAGLNGVAAIARTIYMKFLIGLSVKTYLNNVVWKIFIVTFFAFSLSYLVANAIDVAWLRLLITTTFSTLALCFFAYVLGLDNQERNFCKIFLSKFLWK